MTSLSRRHFLRGLGGVTLALPTLPSLLTASEAAAQASQSVKRFVQFCSPHGAIWSNHMFPARVATPETQMYAGRAIRRQPLQLQVASGRASLSRTLTADSSVLTSSLAAKMNVIQGLDIPFYIGHHTGGYLGNYARNDGNGADGVAMHSRPRPTIDQLMAWSPDFSGNLQGIRERVVVLGGRISYNWANPETRTGAIQEIGRTANSSFELFDKLFPGATGPAPRPLIVDQVRESYRRLRESNRRLSEADKRRLDEHMQRVFELQRRLQAAPTCTTVTKNSRNSSQVISQAGYGTNPNFQAEYHQLFNEVAALALNCGVTRVVVAYPDDTFSTFNGDWHQDVAHKADVADGVAQGTIANANQVYFEKVFLDFVKRLEVDDGNGGTLLDSSLCVWTQESGNLTHNAQSLPVVTFGGAGGFLQTGHYLDYRNLALTWSTGEAEKRYPGLLWNQWLGTVLQSMGLPPSRYEANGIKGYPDIDFANVEWASINTAQAYPSSLWSVTGDVLPWLKK